MAYLGKTIKSWLTGPTIVKKLWKKSNNFYEGHDEKREKAGVIGGLYPPKVAKEFFEKIDKNKDREAELSKPMSHTISD